MPMGKPASGQQYTHYAWHDAVVVLGLVAVHVDSHTPQPNAS